MNTSDIHLQKKIAELDSISKPTKSQKKRLAELRARLTPTEKTPKATEPTAEPIPYPSEENEENEVKKDELTP